MINPWDNEEECEDVGTRVTSNRGSCVAITRGVSGKASAYIEWGAGESATKLVAVVRGPRQQSMTRSHFDVEISFPSFAGTPSHTSEVGRDLSAYVKEAIEGTINMEQYPNAAISIHIKVLQCNQSIHSLISPAIAAAIAACREGGISMKEAVVAVPVAIVEQEYVVDPNAFPPTAAAATIAFNVESRSVSLLHLTGIVKNADAVDSMVNVADGIVGNLVKVLGLVE